MQMIYINLNVHLGSFGIIARRFVVELCPPPVPEISRALSANRPLPVSRAIVQR